MTLMLIKKILLEPAFVISHKTRKFTKFNVHYCEFSLKMVSVVFTNVQQCRNQFPFSTSPLRSPKDSPEVSWEENEVEVVAGEREVLASEDPSDIEGREELGEVGGRGLNPSSEK